MAAPECVHCGGVGVVGLIIIVGWPDSYLAGIECGRCKGSGAAL